MISLHSATKDVLLEKSQMDQTKAHLATLEQALLSKGIFVHECFLGYSSAAHREGSNGFRNYGVAENGRGFLCQN